MQQDILKTKISLFVILAILLVAQPAVLFANQQPRFNVQTKNQKGRPISRRSLFKTPYLIELARQGDVKALLAQMQDPATESLLQEKDLYQNNVFHVAKNADTVQALASLIRHFYKNKAQEVITSMIDARNTLGETPLMAQINAAHADTFRPLYLHASLKKKNDYVKKQLNRLHGSPASILQQHKNIYCQDILKDSSSAGRNLLQAAQEQAQYKQEMGRVARMIYREMPCLVDRKF